MATRVATEVDLCPICGASGQEFCTEEDGQTVLDHWGRPDTLPDEVAPRGATLPRSVAA